jgi:hypothetical protein
MYLGYHSFTTMSNDNKLLTWAVIGAATGTEVATKFEPVVSAT